MNRFWRWTVRISAVLCVVAVLAYGAYEYFINGPLERFFEFGRHPENYSASDARKILHDVLRPPFHGNHDAFLFAISFGNAETVPLLIEDLKWQPETKPGDKGMDCEKAHCLEALRTLTGQNEGRNYQDWKKWYLEHSKYKTN